MHYFRDFFEQLANETVVPLWMFWMWQDFFDIQLPIYILIGLVVFRERLTALVVVSAHNKLERREQKQWKKKWRRTYAMSPGQFSAEIAKLKRQSAALKENAQSLDEQALENRFAFVPGAQESLLHAASVKRAKADEIDEEIREQQSIRQRALAERATIDGDPARVIDDIMLLNSSDDDEAQEALSRLNNARGGRWLLELPNRIAIVDRPTITACLRSMAGASTLNEARAALNAVGRILQRNNLTWQEFLT
jgi:hypothetical protein